MSFVISLSLGTEGQLFETILDVLTCLGESTCYLIDSSADASPVRYSRDEIRRLISPSKNLVFKLSKNQVWDVAYGSKTEPLPIYSTADFDLSMYLSKKRTMSFLIDIVKIDTIDHWKSFILNPAWDEIPWFNRQITRLRVR